MSKQFTRRAVVATLGLGGAVGVDGCAGGETSTTRPTATPPEAATPGAGTSSPEEATRRFIRAVADGDTAAAEAVLHEDSGLDPQQLEPSAVTIREIQRVDVADMAASEDIDATAAEISAAEGILEDAVVDAGLDTSAIVAYDIESADTGPESAYMLVVLDDGWRVYGSITADFIRGVVAETETPRR